MTQLGREAPEDLATFFRNQHAQWVTEGHVLEDLLKSWGMTNTVIGSRIATGEATEVYRVYDGSTDDILGYLRIAHRGSGALNGSEILLMRACFENGLPSVELFHKLKSKVNNGEQDRKVVVTFVAPASGINLSDAISSGDFDESAINQVVRNVGGAIARMHELPANSPKVSKRIGKFLRKETIPSVSDFFSQTKKLMRHIRDAKPLLKQIQPMIEDVQNSLDGMRGQYPFVMIHSDVEPKHVFFDPETLEITSIIDFGSAQVNSPHFDFLNWKTFSPDTFEEFIDAYTSARFGQNTDQADRFKDEIDVAEVAWQLDWAIYRMDQLLVPEAIGHLELCASACERIVSRAITPLADPFRQTL